MSIQKVILDTSIKKVIFENPDGKPLSGWQLSGILLDTNNKYRVQSVVSSKEGTILRVDCLTKAND